MFLVFHFFVVIPGHNLGNSQVSVYRTIGPTLVFYFTSLYVVLYMYVTLSQYIDSVNS